MRRFRGSVFCGREELLLVWTLVFSTSKNLQYTSQKNERASKLNLPSIQNVFCDHNQSLNSCTQLHPRDPQTHVVHVPAAGQSGELEDAKSTSEILEACIKCLLYTFVHYMGHRAHSYSCPPTLLISPRVPTLSADSWWLQDTPTTWYTLKVFFLVTKTNWSGKKVKWACVLEKCSLWDFSWMLCRT